MAIVNKTVKFIRALGRAWAKKWSFLAAFLVVFFVTFTTLAAFDLVPEAPTKVAADTTVPSGALAAGVALAAPEKPVRIVVPAIDLDVAIKNPESTNTSRRIRSPPTITSMGLIARSSMIDGPAPN